MCQLVMENLQVAGVYSALLKLLQSFDKPLFLALRERNGPEHRHMPAPNITETHRQAQSHKHKQNFKSPSTTSQPPSGMGLIYMKNKGNRVEEEIKHRIIKNRKWG